MTVRHVHDPELDRDLIIDPDIPGQIAWPALIAMAHVAAQLPPNSIVVETGSLFGRSSFVWAMNTDPSTRVFCIDPWVREDWIVQIVEKPQNVEVPFSIDAHRYYTAPCGEKITRIKGYSPHVVHDWNMAIDLYFDDSDHEQPGLGRNWAFWEPWVKPGGVFSGDEFDSAFPDCVENVRRLEAKWNSRAQSNGLFWWMHKPASVPTTNGLRSSLLKMSAKAGLFRRRK